MAQTKLIITPKTKIGELLEAYPELESVLISLSPVFEKLKNPILRKTVAKVATIQQISVVGGLPVDTIINRLRSETGQTGTEEPASDHLFPSESPPSWFSEKNITLRYDATPFINSGESPMTEILKQAQSIKPGEIFELQTPFIPAPILDMLRKKQFRIYTVQKGNFVVSYISVA